MTLRTQVLVAVLAILILPLTALGSLFSIRNGGNLPGQAILRYIYLVNWTKTSLEPGPDGRPVVVDPDRKQEVFDYILLDADGKLVVSTRPFRGTPPTGPVSWRDLLPLGADPAQRFFWQSLVHRGEIYGSVLVLFPVPPATQEEDWLGPLDWLSLYVILFLITSGFWGFWLSRLERQVSLLRRATELLAQGSWEVPTSLEKIRTREFVELGQGMEALRVALLSEQQKRARFLAAVSHDLRTPLTSIQGYLEAIEDGLASGPGQLETHLRIIRSKAGTLDDRIADLLDYTRMESQDWQPRLRRNDLTAFLATLGPSLNEDGRLLGVAVQLQIEVPVLWAAFDPPLLTRALEHLVGNAFRLSPPGGRILLGLSEEPQRWVLSVEDQGPGIAPLDQPYVFEPFFRGSGSRGTGQGLGLFIAKTVIQGHGWNLVFDDTLSTGTRFLILLPKNR